MEPPFNSVRALTVKFSDFSVGRIIVAGTHTVEESSIVRFGTQFDPQPFHVDKNAATAGHWHGLIASGFHTCSIAMRLVADNILRDSESYASPGLEYVKWPAPVRAGDSLTLAVEVLSVRRSRSEKYGIVRWQWRMTNQRSETVLDLIATSLFGLAAIEDRP
jgi:acyl dehydratase